MSFFFSCRSFFFKFRERERGYIKLVIKRNGLKVYLSFFFEGVMWRIFLLLRANRLNAIFNTGLKNLGPSCPRYVFVFFTRSTGIGSVCHEPCPITNFFFSFLSLTGRRCHFRFRVPANHLASLFLPPGQAIS